MNNQRRTILRAGALAAAALASNPVLGVSAPEPAKYHAGKSIRILVLGGTGFIGPHMVREALHRGHEVSLFNRGRTDVALFPDLKIYIGDRDNQLDALEGHEWDAIIDNSGYVPRHVADSARLLASASSHYLFISSTSVYANFATANHEGSPLLKVPNQSIEEVTAKTYGPMKVLSEKMAAREFGKDRLTVLRPTYICGPGDDTDRYTYWPVRTMRGGKMLWPGDPSDPIQIIDVRDLAVFTIDCVEQQISGTYNVVTPPGSATIGELLQDSIEITDADVTPVWASTSFLREQAVLQDIPIWAPPTGETALEALTSGALAYEKGLTIRPTRETARDTLHWWKTLPPARTENLRAGLSAQKEASLLLELSD